MICENCGNNHNGNYGSGRFCKESCSRSFSSKKNKGEKEVFCFGCGEKISVDKRTGLKNSFCFKCKKLNSLKARKRFEGKSDDITGCSCCGDIICKRKDICNKYQLIPALIKYFGFKKEVVGSNDFYKEFDKIKTILSDDYLKLSTIEMADKYGHRNYRNFYKIIKAMGIKTRDLSESSFNALKTGRSKINIIKNSMFKHGWHTSWNGKKFYYRSSYELDFCKELDLKKIDYNMEDLRIVYWDSEKLKQRIAVPDFHIGNEIVEIKSLYSYNENNMKDKFLAYRKLGFVPRLILEHKEIYI